MPKITRIVREDVEWQYGPNTWVLRHDAPGVPKFIQPDQYGNIVPPSHDNYQELLAAVLDPAQLEEASVASDSGDWPAADQYEAAVAFWRYMLGYLELQNQILERAKLQERMNVRAREILEEAEKEAKEAAGSGVVAGPLEDSPPAG